MVNINYKDSRPIWEQIRDNLRKLIITHALKKDDKLPSVRDMASELAINPNTIQRAYRELEAEGYIYSVAGRGSFVSDVENLKERHVGELMDKLYIVVRELVDAGVEYDEIVTGIKTAYYLKQGS